ncbi:MAG: hypothetical protein RR218_05625 [Gordonibacter sp.]
MIVFASLGILFSLLTTLGGSVLGTANSNDAMVAGGLLAAMGIITLIGSIVDLVIGIFGLRGANDPSKIGVFFVLAIIGVVFAALVVLGNFMNGSMDAGTIFSSLLGLVLPVVCVILANNIKKENRL